MLVIFVIMLCRRTVPVYSLQNFVTDHLNLKTEGWASKNVLFYILFLFVSATENQIFKILAPIHHTWGDIKGVGI
jgi:hypothetical protein